jgi:Lrp/AsnC family leucine-responsive transcriptional regulator
MPLIREWPLRIVSQPRPSVCAVICSVLVVATESMEAFEGLIDRLAAYGRPSSSRVLSDFLPWCATPPPAQRPPASA